MAKVAQTALKVLKLPAVPSRDYSMIQNLVDDHFLSVSVQAWSIKWNQSVLHQIQLVTSPSAENKGSKLTGRAYKTFLFRKNFLEKISDILFLICVLPWLSHKSTLAKEFEKDNVANIRLRAIPTLIWVAYPSMMKK